jgi:hypothetical protein
VFLFFFSCSAGDPTQGLVHASWRNSSTQSSKVHKHQNTYSSVEEEESCFWPNLAAWDSKKKENPASQAATAQWEPSSHCGVGEGVDTKDRSRLRSREAVPNWRFYFFHPYWAPTSILPTLLGKLRPGDPGHQHHWRPGLSWEVQLCRPPCPSWNIPAPKC